MWTDSKSASRDESRPPVPIGRLQGAASSSNDWPALLSTRANVLVSGPTEALTDFVRAARPVLREPVQAAARSAPLCSEAAGTLILTDVDALDEAAQQWLMRWLNDRQSADTQVISLTSVPLLSLVETHRFDSTLFYRLNTIHLKI